MLGQLLVLVDRPRHRPDPLKSAAPSPATRSTPTHHTTPQPTHKATYQWSTGAALTAIVSRDDRAPGASTCAASVTAVDQCGEAVEQALEPETVGRCDGTFARGAVAYAASFGAPAVEAHPVDPPGHMDLTMPFVGAKAMFVRAGSGLSGQLMPWRAGCRASLYGETSTEQTHGEALGAHHQHERAYAVAGRATSAR